MGFLIVPIDPVNVYVQNLKFVALPIPEIIGGIQKIGQPLDTPTLPSPKFLMRFCSDGP